VNYEWDENKNRRNIKKHGLDFTDAILVFDAPMMVAEDARNDYGETRLSGIGIINNIFVVVIFTENNEKDTRRIISFRKATRNERTFYENNIQL
jgi:uncharacterized protein